MKGLVLGLCIGLVISACGGEVKVPTVEEAAEIMKSGIGFPRTRTVELPVEVDQNDWQSAFSVGNRLNQFYKAGLVEYTAPEGNEKLYKITLTDKGSAALTDKKIYRGGEYNHGYYQVKLSLDKFDRVFSVKEYQTYEIGTGVSDMLTTDVTFSWIPTEVTPFGEAMNIKENQPERASKGIILWAGKWKYMSQ
jgi:hypothetical protein